MKWKLHNGSRFLELFDDWATNLDEAFPANPLLHPDFMQLAIEHFGDDRVRILEGMDSDRTEILVPVIRRMPGSWRTFSPSQLPVAPIYDIREGAQAIQGGRLLRRRSPHVDRRHDEDDRAIADYLPGSGRAVHCGSLVPATGEHDQRLGRLITFQPIKNSIHPKRHSAAS